MGIQIGGMSSGLDTTSMVKELMKAESTKLQALEQDKKLLELKKEAYNKVNNSYADFVNEMRDLFGVTGTLNSYGHLRQSSISNINWMYSALSSSSSISTSTTSSAKPGRYELEVKQLADNFKTASAQGVSVNKNGTTVAESLGLDENEMINFTMTNSKGESVTINQTAGSLSLSELASKLNELDGVTVQYEENIDRFFFSTDETGASNGITFEDNTLGGDGLLNALKLTANGSAIASGTTYTGKNAIVNFNGASGIEFSSNNFQLQGINISLKNNQAIGEKIEVTVDTDVDALVGKVTKFVDSYNKLVEDISSKLSETFYKDFPPLTDEQRKELKESEIKLWEEKSNSGLVRNDDVIQRVQSSLREALMTPITTADGRKVSLADLGITTKSYFDGGKNGALTVDKDKLKASLQKDPNLFQDVFLGMAPTNLAKPNANLTASEKAEKYEKNGIFNRLTDAISDGIGDIVKRGGLTDSGDKYRAISSNILVSFTSNGSTSYLDSLLKSNQERTKRMNKQLASIESRYWKQFTAMETALSKLQSQQSAFYNGF